VLLTSGIYSITILTSTGVSNAPVATIDWKNNDDALANHNSEPAANAIALPLTSTLCLLVVDVNELILKLSPAPFNTVEATIDTSPDALPNPTANVPAEVATFSVKKIPKDVTKDPAGMKLASSLLVSAIPAGIVTVEDILYVGADDAYLPKASSLFCICQVGLFPLFTVKGPLAL